MDYSCAMVLPCLPPQDPPTPTTNPGTPTVTVNDLAAFAPATPRIQSEPGGWAVIGLDTNFYLAGNQPVLSGTLLGAPAQVRFTAIGSTWDYGDGGTATADTVGATWAALHVPEFSPTDTSHVYRDRADYVVHGSVVLAAEYRINSGPWSPVEGTLAAPAAPLTLTTWHAKTVLVDNP